MADRIDLIVRGVVVGHICGRCFDPAALARGWGTIYRADEHFRALADACCTGVCSECGEVAPGPGNAADYAHPACVAAREARRPPPEPYPVPPGMVEITVNGEESLLTREEAVVLRDRLDAFLGGDRGCADRGPTAPPLLPGQRVRIRAGWRVGCAGVGAVVMQTRPGGGCRSGMSVLVRVTGRCGCPKRRHARESWMDMGWLDVTP